ncbi:hypothetical protein GCM10009533_10830 [Saccharopolyspora spinosporotrichia]|uniref:Uncharacterized protein n=1 Tax=Saccharopolyspora erythraea TaxID=1836 RepID=A0ABP3M8Z2_SACER
MGAILWWDRAGKGLQFVAGLVVLIDIYGPKRLEALRDRSADRAERSMHITTSRSCALNAGICHSTRKTLRPPSCSGSANTAGRPSTATSTSSCAGVQAARNA